MGVIILLIPSIWAFYQCFCIYSHIDKSVQIDSEETGEKAAKDEMDEVVCRVMTVRYLAGQEGHMMGV